MQAATASGPSLLVSAQTIRVSALHRALAVEARSAREATHRRHAAALIDIKDERHRVVLSPSLPGLSKWDGVLVLKGETGHRCDEENDNLLMMGW